jgi:signal transduction histidine kinase
MSFKEIINNVAKHSKATHVNVRLGNYGPVFEMSVSDNGTGAPTHNGFAPKGQGLSNLSMRAQRLDAELMIDGESGYEVRFTLKKFT